MTSGAAPPAPPRRIRSAPLRRPGLAAAVLALLGVTLVQACTDKTIVAIDIGGITVTPSTATLRAGQTVQFRAIVEDLDGNPLPRADVVWSADPPDIVTVDGAGMAEALAPGTVEVSASFRGVRGTADVTVAQPAGIGLSEDSLRFYGAAGAQSPAERIVLLTNLGDGPLTGITTDVTFGGEVGVEWVTPTLASTDAPTTLTVTLQTATLPLGIHTATIEVSSPDDPSGPAVLPLTLSITDLTIVESDDSTHVEEAGAGDDFTVALASEPASDVVVDIFADPADVAVAPTRLTFTPADWNLPRTVTVDAVEDLIPSGDRLIDVSMVVDDAASDPAFAPIPPRIVRVRRIDDEDAPPGITLTAINTTIVNETGTLTDDFTVVLDASPSSDVVVTVTSDDPGEVVVDRSSLTFTPSTWNVPQAVTVIGVDDDVIDGDVDVDVVVAVDDAASDDGFDGIVEQLTWTNLDDDLAGLAVVALGGISVNEGGSTDDFTVRLTSEPVSDVVIDITTDDATETSVGPTPLTFTTADWNAPRTVTVTGVDDADDDGDQTSTISITVRDADSDDAYDGLVETLLANTADDDGVGFTITEQSSTAVTEAASIDSFTVVLNAAPASDVVLLVTSADEAEVIVSPPSLTFTTTDWNVARRVTVTGVDDDYDDGDQETDITVSVDGGASDPAYGVVPPQVVVATTLDDDTAGLLLADHLGTSVPESGTPTDPFTVRLTARPVTDVVVDITSSDIVEATVSPPSLTFTTSNWADPQTVTVTGGNDDIDDGDQVTQISVAVNDGASDDAFDAVPTQTVDVTTVDDDSAGLTLSGTAGITLTEAGGSGTFTIRLDAQPVRNVLIDLTSSDPSESSVSPPSVTFTPGNWSTPRDVTVAGVDDALIDGAQPSTISATVNDEASDDAFDGLSVTFGVSTSDDDAAGFTIREIGGTRVSEGGGTDEFFVRLDAQPSGTVVFDLASSPAGHISLSSSQLTFTPADWADEQAVTVTGIDDDEDSADVTVTVTVTANAGLTLDNLFDGLSGSVSVTKIDNDGVGLTITEISSTTVPESGLFTDEFDVELDTSPASNVVITITSTDTDEASVLPTSLTFTPSNWNVRQTVTVMGVDDDVIDGDQDTDILVEVDDASSDPSYAALSGLVVATTTDDDVAGFVLERTTGLSVNESGSITDDFDVRLTAEPASNVVLTVTSLNTAEVLPAAGSVTFTPADWNVVKPVTLVGQDDDRVDGSVVSQVRVAVNAGASDPAWAGVGNQTVGVTTTDDDVAGLAVGQSLGNTQVAEAAGRDTITVVLEAEPLLNVVVTITSADLGEVGVSPTALTFTPGNWDSIRHVVVTGANEVIDDGNQSTLVTLQVDNANSDDAFDGLIEQVSVTTIDDDDAGFVLTGTSGLTVSETGTSTQFSVALLTEPVSNVVLSATTGDPDEVSVTTPTRTFTPLNWSTPQPITVRGVDDDVDDGDQSTTVTISVVDASSDDAFDLLANQFVTVTTTDDDTAGFTLADTLGLTVNETGTFDQFTVVLNTQPTSNVVLSLTSNDLGEVSVSPPTITFVPGSWDFPQVVTVTGEDDALIDGERTSLITVAVIDASSDDTFDGLSQSVSVRTDDDDGAGLVVTEQGGTRVNESGSSDEFEVRLGAEPSSDVVVDIVSEDTGEVIVDLATLTFTTGNWATPRTVVVSSVDDAIDDGDVVTRVTITVNDAASDDAFDGLADTVFVTTTDDDGVGFTITEFGGTQVAETGAGVEDQFGVSLDAQPATDVVLTITSTDLGEATVDRATLTFTNSNWASPQQVVVSGVDDLFADGAQTTPVVVAVDAAASNDAFDGVPPDTVQVTTTDNEVAGFSATATGGSTVATEGGATDEIEVVLTARPLTPVVINAVSSSGEASVSPASLSFDSLTWSTPQSFTITAADDQFVDGTGAANITVSVNEPSSDGGFAGLGSQVLGVTTNDDDIAGIIVSNPTGATTQAFEGGATDTLTVRLGPGRPQSSVTVQVTASVPGQVTLSQTSLTFTSGNWSSPRNVIITAENEAFVDGDVDVDLTVAVVDASSNDFFDGLSEVETVTARDNDVASFTMSPTGGSTTVGENGSTDAVSIALGAGRPLTPVIINLVSDDTGEVTLDSLTVTFDSLNWQTTKSVVVRGVNDGSLVDGPVMTDLVATVAGGSNAAWLGQADTVVATTTDNDTAGYAVTETNGSTITSEDETTDSIQVVLTGQPATDVVIDVVSSTLAEATVSAPFLTFTNGNWNVPQWVVVTGVDHAEPIVDGPQTFDIDFSVDDAASNDFWDLVPDQAVTMTNNDNDVPGFTLSHASGGSTVVDETTTVTDSVSVVLTAQPALGQTIVINFTSSDEGEMIPELGSGVPATYSLSFTASNWNQPQYVSVKGEPDSTVDGTQFPLLQAVIDPGAPTLWLTASPQSIQVTVLDID